MTFSVCLWKTDHSVIFLIDSALVFFTRSIALCLSFLSVVTVFSIISAALSCSSVRFCPFSPIRYIIATLKSSFGRAMGSNTCFSTQSYTSSLSTSPT